MASVAKELELALIHEILPKEIFVKILKKLGYKSISFARLTCKRWNRIIHNFGLIKIALSKFEINSFALIFS